LTIGIWSIPPSSIDRDIGALADIGIAIDPTIAAEVKAIAADCRKRTTKKGRKDRV
jgi:hypothetical protein